VPKRIWAQFDRMVVLALAVGLPSLLAADIGHDRLPSRATIPLEMREQRIWKLPVHASEFADVPHSTAKSRCENTQAPEALTTPNPVLDGLDSELSIQVSFIVGTDGRVHSPLILQSAGSTETRVVLNTVRSWRYRPAMCNGVPTETEGKIQFSSR
jgi:Gram-negative bacterial TonB protein C-terminal